MAACEDQLVATDVGIDKALVDELWLYLQGPGVTEQQWGTNVEQMGYAIDYIGQKFGKTAVKRPIYSYLDVIDQDSDHAMIAEHNLMNFGENHWLLRRKKDLGIDLVSPAIGDEWLHVDDSAQSLDYSDDHFPAMAVYNAGQALMGAGAQIGWLWTWV